LDSSRWFAAKTALLQQLVENDETQNDDVAPADDMEVEAVPEANEGINSGCLTDGLTVIASAVVSTGVVLYDAIWRDFVCAAIGVAIECSCCVVGELKGKNCHRLVHSVDSHEVHKT
jgi:hypothetical protein